LHIKKIWEQRWIDKLQIPNTNPDYLYGMNKMLTDLFRLKVLMKEISF